MGSKGSKRNAPEKKIVIVGAGYAGAMLGVELLKIGANFIIIDAKNAFYHNVGAVRAVTEPDFIRQLFIPYDDTFGEHFVQGKVVSIDAETNIVKIHDGVEIVYDMLVIATGSSGLTPFKTKIDTPEIAGYIRQCHTITEEVRISKKFVIVGGGAVGCEIAGELLTDYTNVDVTLIHSRNGLVTDDFGSKFQKKLRKKLERMGAVIVLGESVVNGLENASVFGPGDVTTNKGHTYTADVIFRCTGVTVNSQAYAMSLGDAVNDIGALQVNEFLQVKEYNNIFAVGDCNDVKESKLAYRAMEQVKVLKHNLTHEKFKKYDPGAAKFGIGVSLGRNDCVAVTAGGISVPSFITVKLKSRDLMVREFWKHMRQTPTLLDNELVSRKSSKSSVHEKRAFENL